MGCLALTWTNVALPSLGVAPGSSVGAKSLFVQQAARMFREHPDDLTKSEQGALLSVMPGGDALEQAADAYTPYVPDHAKALFNLDDAGATLSGYLKAWVSMELRRPRTYLASVLQGSLGYWLVPIRGCREGGKRALR